MSNIDDAFEQALKNWPGDPSPTVTARYFYEAGRSAELRKILAQPPVAYSVTYNGEHVDNIYPRLASAQNTLERDSALYGGDRRIVPLRAVGDVPALQWRLIGETSWREPPLPNIPNRDSHIETRSRYGK